ncbi:Arginase [Giardia muris]|uniref:Arginase n=1 Tax=Giardia muris TaxID=5742 RepID=A0A4Z1T335_GIAMU|nr:Arginase [Giardia muris]TNJ28359.1 Arginase [Giardia muris]|eukprot:TNJ28353.1 Arginase [Giardia muris]
MTEALRLIFPQWQGADSAGISHYLTDLHPTEAAQGYHLGSQLLFWLASRTDAPTETVPVSLDLEDTKTENGIFAYQAIKRQLRGALDIVSRRAPKKITTLGGECSVSVVPFSYLISQYPGDVALVWLDAHPDLTLPHEDYTGFHAMALAALLGKGDPGLVDLLPGKIDPSCALLVGMHSAASQEDIKRPERFGVQVVSAADANNNTQKVLEWVRRTEKRKVLVHLDLDCLDPNDLRLAVTSDPNGLRLETVSNLIREIAAEFELVGLTVAEPVPREVCKLRRLLGGLPLI